MKKLEGKVAIVTGGAMGIGLGISLCFAEEGADLVIADINIEAANKTADDIRALGRKALVVAADVSKKDDAKRLVEAALSSFGQIDILINNSAGGHRGAIAESSSNEIGNIPEEVWDDTYCGVLKSQVMMCKLVVPHMKERKNGKIVNISSVAAKLGNQSQMAYSSLKGAVISFTRSLAREVAKNNVNVNCICPGLIYTPAWQKKAEDMWKTVPAYRDYKESKEIFLRWVERLTPMRREQTAEDIGRAAAFLCSEDARNITGQSLNVDGGQVMD